MRRRFPVALAVTLASALAAGCGTDQVTAPPTPTLEELPWGIELNHRAVTLARVAPFDTLRLVVTALNYRGDTLAVAKRPSFRSLAPNVVGVDSLGKLVARANGATSIIVGLATSDVTLVDTIAVRVTSTAPASPLARLEVVPPTELSMGFYNDLVPVNTTALAYNEAGTTMGSLSIHYRTLDPTVLTVDRTTGLTRAVRPGQAPVVATATAYGVTRVDTALVTGTNALMHLISSPVKLTADGRQIRVFEPAQVTLARGGSIAFVNGTLIDRFTDSLDIVFDLPEKVGQDERFCFCGTGNIAPFVQPTFFEFLANMRSFPENGTYHFRSLRTGATGIITVVDP